MPLTDALIAAQRGSGGLAVLHRYVHVDRLAETLEFQSIALPGP